MPLKAIIFDVDGTLAETEEAHRAAFNWAFADSGLSWCWSPQDYGALLTTTGGRERIARYMTELGLVPDPDLIAALHGRKNHYYARLVSQGSVVPRPGVVRLIEAAQRGGIQLAIATTTSRPNLVALLRHLFGADALGWFSAMVTGEDVAAKKPDPEVYRRVLKCLSLAAGDCVAIEDSCHGLASARACNIATVVTPSRYTESENFAGAMVVCDSLCDADRSIDIARLQALLELNSRSQDWHRMPS